MHKFGSCVSIATQKVVLIYLSHPSKPPEIELREKTLRSNSCTNSAVVAPNGHSMCLECAKIVVTDVFKRLYDDACDTSPPDDLPGFDFL